MGFQVKPFKDFILVSDYKKSREQMLPVFLFVNQQSRKQQTIGFQQKIPL